MPMPLQGNFAEADGLHHGIGAAEGVKLTFRVFHVPSDGRHAQRQYLGDLFVRLAGCNPLHDFPFAWSQRGVRSFRPLGLEHRSLEGVKTVHADDFNGGAGAVRQVGIRTARAE
jgi:hypothetical protein